MIRTSKVSLVLTFFLIPPILSSTSSIASLVPQDEGNEEKRIVPYNPNRSGTIHNTIVNMGVGCDILGVGEILQSCSSAYGSLSYFTRQDASEEGLEDEREQNQDQSAVSTLSGTRKRSSMNPFGCLPLLNPTQIYELTRDTFIRLSTSMPEQNHEDVDTVNASMNDEPSIFWPFWSENYFSPFSVSAEKKNQ